MKYKDYKSDFKKLLKDLISQAQRVEFTYYDEKLIENEIRKTAFSYEKKFETYFTSWSIESKHLGSSGSKIIGVYVHKTLELISKGKLKIEDIFKYLNKLPANISDEVKKHI
ncbi:MAG: hypothetical protein NZ870_00320, partial [bacterium]|nr:hypothetical protein [bacterium]